MIATRRIPLSGNASKVRVHAERKPWNAKRAIYASVFLACLMAAIIAVQNQHLVQNEYELWALKKEWLATVKHNEQLKLEVAQLKSPVRIQQFAAAKMGMIVPATVYQVGVKGEEQDARVADATEVAGNVTN